MNEKHFGILLLASLLFGVSVPAATLFMDAGSTNPIVPYTNWPTAAIVIQDAVDAAVEGMRSSSPMGSMALEAGPWPPTR